MKGARSLCVLGLLGLLAPGVRAGAPQPSPGLMPNPALGGTLYAQHCASCHGAALQGSDKGPPMLSPIYRPGHHGDLTFQMAVAYGARAHHWNFGDMLPVPAVGADEVAHIVAYVRMRQRQAGIR